MVNSIFQVQCRPACGVEERLHVMIDALNMPLSEKNICATRVVWDDRNVMFHEGSSTACKKNPIRIIKVVKGIFRKSLS